MKDLRVASYSLQDGECSGRLCVNGDFRPETKPAALGEAARVTVVKAMLEREKFYVRMVVVSKKLEEMHTNKIPTAVKNFLALRGARESTALSASASFPGSRDGRSPTRHAFPPPITPRFRLTQIQTSALSESRLGQDFRGKSKMGNNLPKGKSLRFLTVSTTCLGARRPLEHKHSCFT